MLSRTFKSRFQAVVAVILQSSSALLMYQNHWRGKSRHVSGDELILIGEEPPIAKLQVGKTEF